LREATESLIKAARASTDDPQAQPSGSEEEQDSNPTEEYLVEANTGIKIALGFADFVLGFTPAGSVKDLIEAITGVSIVADPGARLEMGERVFLTVTGVVGMVTLGGSNGVTKSLKGLAQIW
jgi:hypothetical protein